MGSEAIITILVFAATFLSILGVYSYAKYRRGRWELGKRIGRIREDIAPQEEENLLDAVRRRVLGNVASLGRFLRPKGEEELSHTRKTFLKAGYRTENATAIFFGSKVFMAILLPLLFVLVKLLGHIVVSSLHFVLILFVLVTIGFYLPNLWLQMSIASRREKMRDGLPDALDLMVVCVEAGTGLDAAINRVGEEMKLSNKVLSDEFKLMALELRAGKERREALKNLSVRTDLEDLTSLVTMLIQTERFGTNLAQALRVHSDFMRVKRFQRAEEMAAKLPVKLIFPLILFIFPALFVTILGPAAIQIFRTLLPTFAGH